MEKFKMIEKALEYKYEAIFVVGLIGTALINEDDPLSSLSGLIMLFGMFGMLAKTISPTINLNLNNNKIPDLNELNEVIEANKKSPLK